MVTSLNLIGYLRSCLIGFEGIKKFKCDLQSLDKLKVIILMNLRHINRSLESVESISLDKCDILNTSKVRSFTS